MGSSVCAFSPENLTWIHGLNVETRNGCGGAEEGICETGGGARACVSVDLHWPGAFGPPATP